MDLIPDTNYMEISIEELELLWGKENVDFFRQRAYDVRKAMHEKRGYPFYAEPVDMPIHLVVAAALGMLLYLANHSDN